jgi:hypothetical protein
MMPWCIHNLSISLDEFLRFTYMHEAASQSMWFVFYSVKIREKMDGCMCVCAHSRYCQGKVKSQNLRTNGASEQSNFVSCMHARVRQANEPGTDAAPLTFVTWRAGGWYSGPTSEGLTCQAHNISVIYVRGSQSARNGDFSRLNCYAGGYDAATLLILVPHRWANRKWTSLNAPFSSNWPVQCVLVTIVPPNGYQHILNHSQWKPA